MEDDFWSGFKSIDVPEKKQESEKPFKVYLFKADDCIRGWLSYVRTNSFNYTLLVEVMTMTSQKAKNKAVTLINAKDYGNINILEANHEDSLWGLNNFPALQKEIIEAIKKQK